MNEQTKLTFAIVFIILTVVFLLLVQPVVWESGDAKNNTRYLLSSISQGLAAAFALVFTITLVAAQLASKYSPLILDQFFTTPIKVFMVFFVISIILPLILLLGLVNRILVYLSLILSITCLTLLIPYFISVKENLKPEKLINRLKDDSIKMTMSKGVKKNFEQNIITLHYINMRAVSEKDYHTLDKGLEALKEIALTENMHKLSHFIETIGENSIDDRFAADMVIDKLTLLTESLIGRKSPKDIMYAIGRVEAICWRATDMGRYEIAKTSTLSVDSIIHYSLKTDESLSSIIAGWNFVMGSYALQRNYEEIEILNADILKKHEKSISIEESFKTAIHISDQHPEWVLEKKFIYSFQKKHFPNLLKPKGR